MQFDRVTRFELDEVAEFLVREFTFINHVDLVIQLGSGQHSEGLLDEVWGRSPLLDLPYMPDEPSIAKHEMEMLWGLINDTRVLVFSGRFHLYEGYGRLPIILPIWAAAEIGARTFLISNAAGGIDEDLQPGTFMLVEDHVNNLGVSPLAGHHHLLRTPYIDMSEVYDRELGGTLIHAAQEEDVTINRGIYWANLGPQFETPSETQLAHLNGGSAVGMSTVMEATIAHALGARVVAMSMITNRASGLSKGKLSHEETIACGLSTGKDLIRIIRRWVFKEGAPLL